MEDEMIYYRQQGSHGCITIPFMKEQMLKMCHDGILAQTFSLEKSTLHLKHTARWLGYSIDMEKYVLSCDSCQKENRQNGKRFGILTEIQRTSKPRKIINIDFATRVPTVRHLS